MRIEISAGGLEGFVNTAEFQWNMTGFVESVEKVISSFTAVHKATGSLVGGTDRLEDAMNQIGARITTEETRKTDAIGIQKKTNDFLDLAIRVDRQVAVAVQQNSDAFYRVHPWLKPPEPVRDDRTLLERLADAACGVADAIRSGVEAVGNWFKDTAQKAYDGLVAFYHAAIDFGKKVIDFGKTIIDFGKRVLGAIWETVKTWFPILVTNIIGKLIVVLAGAVHVIKWAASSIPGVALLGKLAYDLYDYLSGTSARIARQCDDWVAPATHRDVPASVNLEGYMGNVSDVEYARLCDCWGSVSSDADMDSQSIRASFADKLHSLPEGDPLKNVNEDQLIVARDNDTGFSAVAIIDDDGNAIVIFGGTNDLKDFASDAYLAVGSTSPQSRQANQFIKALSASHPNIAVTGHSLGGYLATSVTLYNDNVTKCVAFDPPGRYDVISQNLNNRDNVAKVTTYEANQSVVSSVGFGVGDVHRVTVDPHMVSIAPNHGIHQMYDALGGDAAVAGSW